MMVFKILVLFTVFSSARPTGTIQPHVANYIEEHKFMAIDEMLLTGIPASVSMAQAIIESNAGSSKLARESNNHFGIKCKSYWEGNEYFHPDDDRDAKGNIIPSCFRKYGSVQESYFDHGNFLMNSDHYKPLFNYDKTEYALWAHGLALCGYASDCKYADKIINTIELYGLHELDYYTVQYVDKKELDVVSSQMSQMN